MTCASCGQTLKEGARFCGNCGAPVVPAKAVDAAPPAPVETPTPPPTAGITYIPGTPPTALPIAPVAGSRGRKKIVIGAAAAAAVLVVAMIIGVSVASSISRSNIADDDDSSGGDNSSVSGVDSDAGTDSDGGPAADPASTEPPSDASTATASTVEFASNSGNIRCRIDGDGVICRQGEVKYTVPSGNCSPLSGTTIGVNENGAYWPCLSTDFVPTTKVAYDVPVSANGYSCAINFSTGVTCTNAAGRGFTMEYHAGVSTF